MDVGVEALDEYVDKSTLVGLELKADEAESTWRCEPAVIEWLLSMWVWKLDGVEVLKSLSFAFDVGVDGSNDDESADKGLVKMAADDASILSLSENCAYSIEIC